MKELQRLLVLPLVLIGATFCGIGETQEVKSTSLSEFEMQQAIAEVCPLAKPDAKASDSVYRINNRKYGKRRHTISIEHECTYYLYGLWNEDVVRYLQDNNIQCEQGERAALTFSSGGIGGDVAIRCDEQGTAEVALHLNKAGGLLLTAILVEHTVLYELDEKGALQEKRYEGETAPDKSISLLP